MGKNLNGYPRKEARREGKGANMAKASFTPVGNSADSRRLAQCRDPLYCNT